MRHVIDPRLVLFATLLVATPVAAQVPELIGYTGYLSDDRGAVAGEVEVGFAFYEAEVSSGDETALWSETHDVNAVDGRFSVTLGSVTRIDPLWFDAVDLWVEFTVNGEVMDPRVPLSTVPFAFRAGIADTALSVEGFDPGGYLEEDDLTWDNLVGIPDDLVHDEDIDDVLRGADLDDYVQDEDIGDVVRDEDITDVVREDDITDFVTRDEVAALAADRVCHTIMLDNRDGDTWKYGRFELPMQCYPPFMSESWPETADQFGCTYEVWVEHHSGNGSGYWRGQRSGRMAIWPDGHNTGHHYMQLWDNDSGHLWDMEDGSNTNLFGSHWDNICQVTDHYYNGSGWVRSHHDETGWHDLGIQATQYSRCLTRICQAPRAVGEWSTATRTAGPLEE